MADRPSNFDDVFLPGQAGEGGDRAIASGHIAIGGPPQWTGWTPQDLNLQILQPPMPVGAPREVGVPVVPRVDRPAIVQERMTGQDWFEDVHVIPRSIRLDLVLSTIQISMEVYNADRKLAHDLEAFTNNVDDGVAIIDLPSLPATMDPQHGIPLTLEISPDGPSSIQGTLDFQFDFPMDPTVIMVPVSGDRIVLFCFRPERPLREELRFLTDVLEKIDGTEQRMALRKNPRQELEMTILLEDGPDRARFDFLMFEWQGRSFGLPIWFEPTRLTQDALVDDVTIQVETTAYADYRVGSSAVVLDPEDCTVFDALVVQSLTATSITFEAPLVNAYPRGTFVYPMRQAVVRGLVEGRRLPKNLQEVRLRMAVQDNDSDLADVAAFNSFNGKVLLDGCNFMEGRTVPASHLRRIIESDGMTGIFDQKSLWDRSKRVSAKGFVVDSPQELWEVRQLLHALRGRQTSFYLPTFYEDIEFVDTLASGAVLGTISNVGYDRYVRARSPNNVIRLELDDGTVFVRTIVDTMPIDTETEQLTVDVGWPQTIEPEEIVRVDLFEKVRLASDDVEIVHELGSGDARIHLPVRTVSE